MSIIITTDPDLKRIKRINVESNDRYWVLNDVMFSSCAFPRVDGHLSRHLQSSPATFCYALPPFPSRHFYPSIPPSKLQIQINDSQSQSSLSSVRDTIWYDLIPLPPGAAIVEATQSNPKQSLSLPSSYLLLSLPPRSVGPLWSHSLPFRESL